jgi:Transposase DDE domain group 1
VRRSYANFTYQAGSWSKPRRVIAKVEWHPGELYPRVGFIVTNMSRATENVVAFYNKRGTSEQWIKEFSTTKAFPTEAKSRSGSKRPAPG